MRHYDDHIEVEIKDFIDKVNEILGVKIQKASFNNLHITKFLRKKYKAYSFDDSHQTLLKYDSSFQRKNEISVDSVPEMFNFDEHMKEDIIRNILNCVNRDEDNDYIPQLLNMVRVDSKTLQKVLQSQKRLFKGIVRVMDNELVITENLSKIIIGIKDSFTKSICAYFELNLLSLRKCGTKTQKTILRIENIEKEIDVVFDYDRYEHDFLNLKFTEWCIDNISCSISVHYTVLRLYSIATNMHLSVICKYFLELQIKTFFVSDNILSHVILQNLIFYYDTFNNMENIINLTDTLLYYTVEKICEMKFEDDSGREYIALYESIVYFKCRITFMYQTNNRNSCVENNISSEYLRQIEKLKVRFTEDIANYDGENIRFYLENLFINIENVYNKKLENLLLKDKIVFTLEKINSELATQKNIKNDILIILSHIKKIEHILNVKINIRYDLIEGYVNRITDKIYSEFIYILKLILNNKYEEEITGNEISCLYDCLKFYIKSTNTSEEPFIRQINDLHISNLAKLARKRKNLDSYRVNTLNANHVSFLNLSKLASKSDYEPLRLNYLCKENQELTASIIFYKNKINNLTENEFDTALDQILDKASRLCDRLYLSFKFNLYNQVISEKKQLDCINDIGELFCIKGNDRDYQVR